MGYQVATDLAECRWESYGGAPPESVCPPSPASDAAALAWIAVCAAGLLALHRMRVPAGRLKDPLPAAAACLAAIPLPALLQTLGPAWPPWVLVLWMATFVAALVVCLAAASVQAGKRLAGAGFGVLALAVLLFVNRNMHFDTGAPPWAAWSPYVVGGVAALVLSLASRQEPAAAPRPGAHSASAP